MKVIVYVEGPSDSLTMQELLEGLLQRLQAAGVTVEFFPTEGKRKLVLDTPKKAVNILRNNPETVVIALPDLYPAHEGIAHTQFHELNQGLREKFVQALKSKGVDDTRFHERFKVFCFKHDLEALVLAAENPLASRLGVPAVTRNWKLPVEDQNHDRPPKRIVEELFQAHGDKYRDTIDAPLILGASSYTEITAACPQCFKPFVDYLESLLPQEN